jgi:ribosomal protection tetracycline resistance protein
LRIEPLPPESGVRVALDADPRTLPLFIYKTRDRFATAMTRYIERTLRAGLFGWRVTDCVVTMTESGYYASDGPTKPVSPTPRSTSKDFRNLTPIVLRRALKEARTVVCEPMLQATLEVPNDSVGATLSLVSRLGGVVESPLPRGELSIINLRISAAAVQRLRQQLPELTFGEGVAETTFGGFEPVRGTPPVRGQRNQPANPQHLRASRSR